MLFNPFKEKLYLPTLAIQIGYCLRVNREVIGKKVEGFTGLDVVVFDTSYRMRIIGCLMDPSQSDSLIALDSSRFVCWMRITTSVFCVGFCAYHEKSPFGV